MASASVKLNYTNPLLDIIKRGHWICSALPSSPRRTIVHLFIVMLMKKTNRASEGRPGKVPRAAPLRRHIHLETAYLQLH